MLKRRNRVWKAFGAHGSNYDQYKVLRNTSSEMKSRKRWVYEEALAAEAAFMPKRFYAYLRRRTRATADILSLENNGALAETDADKAEAFVQHYVYVHATDTSPTPQLSCSAPLLSWQVILVDEVCDALSALKPYQSPGRDGLHSIVPKVLAPVIAPTLAILFKQSLTERRLPAEWKTATVRPLFKGGARGDPVNHRPVSLTCVAVKVMERVLAKRLREHLLPNYLLYPEQ
ncbi:unnamed protein product [Echinostoma caproni]|uniref:Reverse transcriptase domain-containing protein n=1 Tax=Echinostoma caproni TaxID=27848 RepID=A0A183BDN7_9TREM|nr:unnamed protein product [Echinostoma caproni]